MYRQYTRCYKYMQGDKPFNINDLFGFVAGNGAPGLIAAIALAASGNSVAAGLIFGIQYAVTITAVANEWLYHRLVCLDKIHDPHCALGTVEQSPERGNLGAFDNDEFINLRLMPHPPFRSATTEEQIAFNDRVRNDGFQGNLLKAQLGLDYIKAPHPEYEHSYFLHCEAEGNFWQVLKDGAILFGFVAGFGAGAGAGAGCALGMLIFGPIGCVIGAILGLIFGGTAGAGLGAVIAFAVDRGELEDANFLDGPRGAITAGDRVVVLGHWVYDGFHDGWNEFHPLVAIQKIVGGPGQYPTPYLESDPECCDPGLSGPYGLQPEDMRMGLQSAAFAAEAKRIRARWCGLLGESFRSEVELEQRKARSRWAIHPDVDGCREAEA